MTSSMQRSSSLPPPELIAQHPPAQKVGGRRLSTTSRPKPQLHTPPKLSEPEPEPEENTDYPRPAAPGEQHHEHRQYEEEQPRREKRHGHGSLEERKQQETLHRKAEQNRPTRDFTANNAKTLRISQPAGKNINIGA